MLGIDIVHAAHVAELLQAIGRQHPIGRHAPEEREAATGHFERRQALITEC